MPKPSPLSVTVLPPLAHPLKSPHGLVTAQKSLTLRDKPQCPASSKDTVITQATVTAFTALNLDMTAAGRKSLIKSPAPQRAQSPANGLSVVAGIRTNGPLRKTSLLT